MHLIFEETTSILYYSNDARLRVSGIEDDDGSAIFVIEDNDDGSEVFATRDRVKADAYIAGYDFARHS